MLTLTPFSLTLLALADFAAVQLIQRLPWPVKWLQRKPLSCAVCLSWWLAIAGCGLDLSLRRGTEAVLVFWAAVAGAAIALDALTSWLKPQPPPM